MRAVVQRVSQAHVVVDGQVVGQIAQGLLVLLAITHTDTLAEARKMAEKIVTLRIFSGEDGRFDRALADGAGGMLIVSQFTLYGDTRKGRRPSWVRAAAPEAASELIDAFVNLVGEFGIPTATGVFGAQMNVTLINDGPVTLILDTDEWSQGRG